MLTKEQLTEDILSGLSVKQIQEKYACSRSTVYYYKKLFGLIGLTDNSKKLERQAGFKQCNSCLSEKSLEEFYSNGRLASGGIKYKSSCKTCEIKNRKNGFYSLVQDYLKTCNREYKCSKCNYTNIFGSLDFHHRNPDGKRFSISEVGKTISLDKFMEEVAPELDKCDILCPNCHRLEHLVLG